VREVRDIHHCQISISPPDKAYPWAAFAFNNPPADLVRNLVGQLVQAPLQNSLENIKFLRTALQALHQFARDDSCNDVDSHRSIRRAGLRSRTTSKQIRFPYSRIRAYTRARFNGCIAFTAAPLLFI
jgi:hypothetical protein